MKTLLVFWLSVFMSLGIIKGNEVFRQLTINEGLAHTDVSCIKQDSTGLIWIGTSAGLQCFDGYSLQTFDYYPSGQRIFQSHNRIHTMACVGGNLWLGTASGITCFDLSTHSFVPYRIEGGEVELDAEGSIQELFADTDGRYLWIKTANDIIAAKVQDNILRLLQWSSDEEHMFGKKITCLRFQGSTIWATVGKYVVRMNVVDDRIVISKRYDVKDLIHSDETIRNIYYINDFLYMRTVSGCYRITVTDNKLRESTLVYVNFHAINEKIPVSTNGTFCVDEDGTLWCAYMKGLFEVRYPFTETPYIREHLRNASDDKLSVQRIKELFIDRYNSLWVATDSWGVFYRPLNEYLVKNISQLEFREMGFLQNEIVSVSGQDDGTIWMIVEYSNLFSYHPQTGQLEHIPLPMEQSQGFYLQTVDVSRDGKHLYIGSSRGVFIYDIQTKKITQLTLQGRILNTSVADMAEDASGRLWIATWGEGLFCIEEPLTSPALAVRLNTHTDPRLLSNLITYVYIKDDTVLLCTTDGLNRLTLTEEGRIKKLSSYQVNEQKGDVSMSSNYLATLDCLNDSTYWIGTIGGGLNKVVLHSEQDNDYTAICYTTQDGLPGNDCEIVFVDRFGNVWVGGNGLFQLDVHKNRIYTYGFADGLVSNAFKINVAYKAKDETYYMGGLFGLCYFQPAKFVHNNNNHKLIFTNLFVNNQQIIPNKAYDNRVVLDKILNETAGLTLNHLQNNFTISFAALGYKLSEQIMYRYRLKGFQDDWRILRHTSNEAYFSNLPYKSYQLEVQLSTDKGYTWQVPGKVLSIEILPPWWLSWWAKLFYVVVVISIFVIAFWQYAKEQTLKRENEIQRILIAQDEEKYEAKMKFFMNASHELKTPLTLILLAAEKLLHITGPSKEGKLILYNVRRMLALISELVDIRKQDLGISTINLNRTNVSQLIRQLFEDVSSWADSKHISIRYVTEETDIKMDADKDKVGKMILNLFSNAIKYTDNGGEIDISFKRGTQQEITPLYQTSYTEGTLSPDVPICILTVRDTGVGISPESIHHIYDRFFQVKENLQMHMGSGIGLAIVKNVVLQHKGMIVVSSERMRGSEFIIALPVYENCREDEDSESGITDVERFIEEQYNEFEWTREETEDKESVALESVNAPSDLPTLLLVEDNKELQHILIEQLSHSYQVSVADNGRAGLEKCMNLFPDIILSDVMMPEMDGIEFCKRVKNNLSMASIPFVLLTAKDTVESQIEGYESGADLYLSKPFSMRLLEVNLCRLLRQRDFWLKKKTEAFKKVSAVEESGSIVDSEVSSSLETENDDVLELQVILERLKAIIGEKIGDPNLSPDQLAGELGISRTKLYRKIKRIDGYSLSDYVRNVRLEKAADLLVSSNLNIQEIMYEVGFINNSHFTKIFKLKYDVTPSQYRRNRDKG